MRLSEETKQSDTQSWTQHLYTKCQKIKYSTAKSVFSYSYMICNAAHKLRTAIYSYIYPFRSRRTREGQFVSVNAITRLTSENTGWIWIKFCIVILRTGPYTKRARHRTQEQWPPIVPLIIHAHAPTPPPPAYHRPGQSPIGPHYIQRVYTCFYKTSDDEISTSNHAA
jgi:hypothetical protein